MAEGNEAAAVAAECAVCRRCVLTGERLVPYREPRSERVVAVCDLCRGRARTRGWQPAGEPQLQRDRRRLRVEPLQSTSGGADHSEEVPELLAPQRAILERAGATEPDAARAPELLQRMRLQEDELRRLRRELDPARRDEEQRQLERQARELRELRAAVQQRDARIRQLELARHAETSPLRMSRFALDAFNQSPELERMARIARTLGEPVVNVHDEGPGIPRRVRVTLSWDIAWYEFVVKLDLGVGRASVHETGAGGDAAAVAVERRRANAQWRDSGIVLT